MATQAEWNGVKFEVWPSFVRPIESLDTSLGIEFERNEDTEGQPATQITRRKLQTISLTYKSILGLWVDPKLDLDCWNWHIVNGFYAPFYLNGQDLYGRNFIITKADMSSSYIDPQGRILYADFSLEFEEYAEEARGLKVDKGFAMTVTPGIGTGATTEQQRALGLTANTNDRFRLVARHAS